MSHYFNVLCLTVITLLECVSIVSFGYGVWLLWTSVRDALRNKKKR